jgi:hypothetical protein
MAETDLAPELGGGRRLPGASSWPGSWIGDASTAPMCRDRDQVTCTLCVTCGLNSNLYISKKF